jgi:hypothetical protein
VRVRACVRACVPPRSGGCWPVATPSGAVRRRNSHAPPVGGDGETAGTVEPQGSPWAGVESRRGFIMCSALIWLAARMLAVLVML